MQFIRSVASNTIYQILARVVSSGTSFLIAIIVARHFGILGYGDLAKITAFVGLFYLFVDFGFNAIFLQIKNNTNFKDLFYLRVVLAFATMLVIACIALLLPYSPLTQVGYSPIVKEGILLFSLTIFFRAISFSTAAVFQEKLSYKYLAFSTTIGSVISFVFVIGAIAFSLPLMIVVLAYVVSACLQAVVELLILKEQLLPIHVDKKFAKKLFLQTLPLTAMLFLNLIYFRVDSFLLALMKSTKDVAIYDLAYKCFDFLIALPLFLSNSIYPTILNSEKNNRIDVQKAFLYCFVFLFIGIIIAIPVWILSPLLVIVKKDFILSALPLRLLVIALPVFFATNILQWILIAKKKNVFLLVVYGVSMIINVLLNLLFIPQWSYVASAIITGVSETLVLIALGGYLFFDGRQ